MDFKRLFADGDEIAPGDVGSGSLTGEGPDDSTAEARAARRHPTPPAGWPPWMFGDMGRVLEAQRLFAELKTAEGSMLDAAHAWDGVRALARLLLGPDDPRSWAALSRSARSLGEHATGGECPKYPNLPSGMPLRLFRARGAISMAAGAVWALGEPRLEPARVAVPRYDSPDGTPGGEPDWVRRARIWDRTVELGFAGETLGMIAGMTPETDEDPPPPLRSLAEALYPGLGPEAGKDPFPSAGELWKRLRTADGPDGPGPGSRESLVLRSLLGAELWDTGGRERSAEALELMREASMGLDGIAGERAGCSLDARERLARRLGGMYGRGTVLPGIPEMPPPPDIAGAVELFRGLERLAPAGPEGEAMRRRAGRCAVALSVIRDGEDETLLQKLISLADRLMSELRSERPSLDACREGLDTGELLRRLSPATAPSADRLFMLSVDTHRNLLGGRHPETAPALASAADMWRSLSREVRPCPFWALALESLEGLGDRYETFRAELELRFVPMLVQDGRVGAGTAALLLASACRRLGGALGATSQPALKASLEAAVVLSAAEEEDAAEEFFTRIVTLLDGAPPRSDPDPRMPSDAAVLSTALAGKGAAMIGRGDMPGGTELLRRSTGIAALATAKADKAFTEVGDFCRKLFQDMTDGQLQVPAACDPGCHETIAWPGPSAPCSALAATTMMMVMMMMMMMTVKRRRRRQ
jgi:hypothetical protein